MSKENLHPISSVADLPRVPVNRAASPAVPGPVATSTLISSFQVSFEYPVVFTRALFDPANPVLIDTLTRRESERKHRVLVLVDAGVARSTPDLTAHWQGYADAHTDTLESVSDPIVIPGGENAKDDPYLQARLSQYIEEHGIDRQSYVLAIGGGAMLDAVGLAAATAHRGVRLIRVPSTVLAQNDAGIGVKNGVNRFGQKNWYGTFAPPFAVINDSEFLYTLSAVERRAGMSEAVKVALIRDAGFFAWIESHTAGLAAFEPAAVRHLIQRCAELHLRQITQGGDPFETGTARPLDFGHWAAHRLERMSEHRLGHGDAVAIGIALDTRYAVLAGLLEPGVDIRVCRVLAQLGFDLWDELLTQRNHQAELTVLEGLDDFRRHLGGELSVTLPREIGTGFEVHEMQHGLLEAAISAMHPGVPQLATDGARACA